MKTQTEIKIEQWPVTPDVTETNKQRIIRLFREHDGEPTCYGAYAREDGSRCGAGLMSANGMTKLSRTVMGSITSHFDALHGSFGDYALHLEECERCWGQGADEPYTGD